MEAFVIGNEDAEFILVEIRDLEQRESEDFIEK